MVRCADGSLYTGIARDVEKRFAEHQAQGRLCAKYLRGKSPLALVWQRPAHDRAEASRWEFRIKRITKAEKEMLVTGETNLEELA